MTLTKIFNQVTRMYKKSTCWCKILYLLLILLVLAIIYKTYKPVREGFVQTEKFMERNGDAIFDDLYVSLYDDLLFSSVKNDYEIGEIVNSTKPNEKSLVLDIGSGTGHHVGELTSRGVPAIGIDKSPSMINIARKNYPKSQFKVGDALVSMTFSQNSFTHITCLFFTIYYIKDKLAFFQNCYQWLVPGGYLILHLVNRDLFDPIVPAADPLYAVSPQKYAKKRITNSTVKFSDLEYKANFEINKNKDLAYFIETLKSDDTGNVRQNRHKLYMATQKHILGLAKDVGFILHGKADLVHCQYEYQYLYILSKPS